MEHFTPGLSALGGALIGLSATLLLLFNGRIAGISGIVSGALFTRAGDTLWRWAFLAGLILGGLALFAGSPELFSVTSGRPIWAIALAGLAVGFGVRLGSGCTSGHGVCGLSRLSPRSLVATLTFIASGAVAVSLFRMSGGVE